MLRPWLKKALILLSVFTLFTCIDPYTPKLGIYKPVMVVEGLVTNEKGVYSIKLSYSNQYKDSVFTRISDATVRIADDLGNITNLSSTGNGVYTTDSATFTGQIGRKYQLQIITSDGDEYASDTCELADVPEIDSVYYGRDEKLTNNQTILRQGISIFVDSKEGLADDFFLRWDFEETWKFGVPYPTAFTYVDEFHINPISRKEMNEFCYKTVKSSSIVISENVPGISSRITGQPVLFVSPEESDRLTIRYSIMVNQYSISHREFKFWTDLKRMNESDGDIFGSQPFAVVGNIRNITKPQEQVLGYFQVSAVKHKRIFIDFNELLKLNLPLYHHTCQLISKSPADYNTGWGPPVTWDDVMTMWTVNVKGYDFVGPQKDDDGNLRKLSFSKAVCADCTVSGKKAPPSFWIE